MLVTGIQKQRSDYVRGKSASYKAIQVRAFSVKANAETLHAKVRTARFTDEFIKQDLLNPEP